MAYPTSKVVLALAALAALVQPAAAQYYNELSRSDFISLSAGDAPQANIAIQTPTPWPPYVNDVNIPGYGPRAVNVIEWFNTLPVPPKPGGGSAMAAPSQ